MPNIIITVLSLQFWFSLTWISTAKSLQFLRAVWICYCCDQRLVSFHCTVWRSWNVCDGCTWTCQLNSSSPIYLSLVVDSATTGKLRQVFLIWTFLTPCSVHDTRCCWWIIFDSQWQCTVQNMRVGNFNRTLGKLWETGRKFANFLSDWQRG